MRSGQLFSQTVNHVGAGTVPLSGKGKAVRRAVLRGPVDRRRRPVAAISSLISSPAQHGKDLIIRQCENNAKYLRMSVWRINGKKYKDFSGGTTSYICAQFHWVLRLRNTGNSYKRLRLGLRLYYKPSKQVGLNNCWRNPKSHVTNAKYTIKIE